MSKTLEFLKEFKELLEKHDAELSAEFDPMIDNYSIELDVGGKDYVMLSRILNSYTVESKTYELENDGE